MAENKELNAKLENLEDENRELSQKNNGNKKQNLSNFLRIQSFNYLN